jgi:hypothetical protein
MDEKRQQGSVDQRDSLDGDLVATLRHGATGDGGAGPGAIEEQQAPAAWQQERALTRSLSCRAEHCRKPPWYVIRMPGGVRGELREELPNSIPFVRPVKSWMPACTGRDGGWVAYVKTFGRW